MRTRPRVSGLVEGLVAQSYSRTCALHILDEALLLLEYVEGSGSQNSVTRHTELAACTKVLVSASLARDSGEKKST